MTENPTYTRICCLLMIGLVGLMSLVFLQACTNAQQLPKILVTTAPPTAPPA